MATAIGRDTKQPSEVLDYDVDFGDWMPSGDYLDGAQVNVRWMSGPQDTPLAVHAVQNTRTVVKVWLSGGANGARYRVELRAATMGGRLREAEFDISVREI
jgi:hypothetical protein